MKKANCSSASLLKTSSCHCCDVFIWHSVLCMRLYTASILSERVAADMVGVWTPRMSLRMLSLQMYYKDKGSVQAHGFSSTYKIYKEVLRMPCSKPCERINPQHVSNFPIPASSNLLACDICEVCGTNGHHIDMVMCEGCNERGKEVQACYTCLPQKQLQWLLDDPDFTHHWRCSFCR